MSPQLQLPDGRIVDVADSQPGLSVQETAVPDRWAILVDLDGTISDHEDRLPLIPDKMDGDWEPFYRNQLSDPVFEGVAEIIRRFTDMYVVIVTARPERFRADSERWLTNNRVNWDAMLMRAEGDVRDNAEVKVDQLAQIRSLGWKPFMAFEDHPDTIKMFREEGIETLSVSNHWEEFK